jgi:hypothetical protein
MASQLSNLKTKLSLSDFKPDRQLKSEGSSKDGKLAATAVSFSTSFSGTTVPKFDLVSGAHVLKDDVKVTITFDKNKSWVAQWILDLPDSDKRKQFLLDHEQGHYSLTALLARDFFIDLMQLKGQSFPDQNSGRAEVTALHTKYDTAVKKVDKKYDDETLHRAWEQLSFGPPRKPAAQTKWEGFISKAFTQERTPRTVAPDGVAYKIPLLDVLKQGGVSI